MWYTTRLCIATVVGLSFGCAPQVIQEQVNVKHVFTYHGHNNTFCLYCPCGLKYLGRGILSTECKVHLMHNELVEYLDEECDIYNKAMPYMMCAHIHIRMHAHAHMCTHTNTDCITPPYSYLPALTMYIITCHTNRSAVTEQSIYIYTHTQRKQHNTIQCQNRKKMVRRSEKLITIAIL